MRRPVLDTQRKLALYVLVPVGVIWAFVILGGIIRLLEVL